MWVAAKNCRLQAGRSRFLAIGIWMDRFGDMVQWAKVSGILSYSWSVCVVWLH